jgi:hypothetical protein
MYVEYVTNQLEFLPALTGFCLLKWLDRIFFLTEVLIFHKPGLIGFFPHGGFIFPQANLIL